jgi:glycosyltransferase involved in cell wall biosynthesis
MIESVFSQTFKDFEIIIVNDGSTDDTAEILNKIHSDKIRIIHTPNNGPAIARNTAIKIARAPVILNLDADDKIANDLLGKAWEIFDKDSNAGIVYCDAEYFGIKTGKLETGEYSKEAMLYDNRITSLSFFRKEDWLAVGGYSDELTYGLEDWDFWLMIIELGREVIKIPDALVYCRTYEKMVESRSGRLKSDRMKMNSSKISIFKRHEKLYLEYPEAWSYFSDLEWKFNNENFLMRFFNDCKYNYMKRFYYK